MKQHPDYSKKHSNAWSYALYCYKNNKKLQKNLDCKLPVSPLNHVLYYDNLKFSINDFRILQGAGKYFQCVGKITIEEGAYIANNVVMITANHEFTDLTKHQPAKDIKIGKNCWIGANSVILPGVTLGDNTIVGAGSIVTKSFRGHVVICGNPAKIIKEI